MTYKEEEKKLFLDFLDRHVLKYWRNDPNTSKYRESLELIITSTCNTKCSYCYYKNYGNNLYPPEINRKNLILDNFDKVINWVTLNNYSPSIEIFSGEFFNLPYYKYMLDKILSETKCNVVIPTNCTFIFDDEKTKDIQKYIDSGRIYLSLSMDGKFLDNETRAIRSGLQYNDEYYDKLFKFAAKNNLGFHPMIGAKGINKWIDTIDWFYQNISKYFNLSEDDKVFRKVYLLEVRNPDWTDEELKYFDEFIEHLVDISYKIVNDPVKYINLLRKELNINLFSQFISSVGRGIGCSIQQSLAIRLGDLALVPCHRTAYEGYLAGRLSFNGKDLDIELENPYLYMNINGFNTINSYKCMDCPINTLCSHGCLGCNFEVNKDFFSPVSTVCKLEFTKIFSIAKAFDKRGILDAIIDLAKLESTQRNKYNELLNIKEIINNGI